MGDLAGSGISLLTLAREAYHDVAVHGTTGNNDGHDGKREKRELPQVHEREHEASNELCKVMHQVARLQWQPRAHHIKFDAFPSFDHSEEERLQARKEKSPFPMISNPI
jgi:hypothetical protein